jgi:hypothetical protein
MTHDHFCYLNKVKLVLIFHNFYYFIFYYYNNEIYITRKLINNCNTTIKFSIKNRKLSESDYFDACFLLIIQFTIQYYHKRN